MKYGVQKLTAGICAISLTPETEAEKSVLRQPELEDTFLFHYQQALQKVFAKDVVFLEIIDSDRYPGNVVVRYGSAKGIGS